MNKNAWKDGTTYDVISRPLKRKLFTCMFFMSIHGRTWRDGTTYGELGRPHIRKPFAYIILDNRPFLK